jgi:hypothetical protein
MSTAFATSQSRLGASAIRRLANATATVQPSGKTVDGIFTRRAVDASLGQSGFVARQVDFVCAQTDAASASIEEGTQLSLDGATWEVTLRTDELDLGQSTLDLKSV